MNDARRPSIAALLILVGVAGCTTNSPYEPAERATATPPATQPALTAGVDPTVASAAIAGAQPPLAPNVAIPPAPEPTATQPSSAVDASTAGRTHVIAKGETLYSISKQYYGTGTKWKTIGDANPGIAPAKLPVGKTIVIP